MSSRAAISKEAADAIASSVLCDYLAELRRIGRLPESITLQREVGGEQVDITVLMNRPVFELAQPADEDPYTRLLLTGTIEIRPAGQPDAPPLTLPLDTAVRLTLN